MVERKDRWRDLPDAQRAKQILVIVFWSAIVILYMLGGFGLILRSQLLKANETPVPTATIQPTSGPTLFPTLTPMP
ncbi:MAG: hypothetical protein LLG44_11400 [Chloroflexi bacterium]|nr:hypothetical protein [Chloroflexota bacterium]